MEELICKEFDMDKLIKGYSKSQLNEAIEEWIIGRNAVRNREILKKKLVDGISYMAIADEYDLSLKRTKTIVREGTHIIIEHL